MRRLAAVALISTVVAGQWGCGLGDVPKLRETPDTADDTAESGDADSAEADTAETDSAAADTAEADTTDMSDAHPPSSDAVSDTVAEAGGDASAWPDSAAPWRAVADFDGDKHSDVFCHGPGGTAPHEGETLIGLAGASHVPAWSDKPFIGTWCAGHTAFGSGDFNGDGMGDVYCLDIDKAQMTIAYSDGSTFVPATMPIHDLFWCFPDSVLVADVNNDGHDDFVCNNGSLHPTPDDQTWVMLADPKGGFGPPIVWLRKWCNWDGSRFGVGDFDGDGRADVWCHDDSNAMFAGKTWLAMAKATSVFEPLGSEPVLSAFCNSANADFGAGDFDGDGHADFYCHGTKDSDAGHTRIALSTGLGSYSITEWRSDLCAVPGTQFGTGDFDGDHVTDFYCHTSTGTTFAYGDPKAKTFVDAPSSLAGCTYVNNQFGTTAN